MFFSSEKYFSAIKNDANASPGATRRQYNIKHGCHSCMACTRTSYNPDSCNPVIDESRSVEYRAFSSRKIPWYLNPVPCNTVQIFPFNPEMVQSRPVPSRALNTPLIPSRDISIPRDPAPRRTFGPEDRPDIFHLPFIHDTSTLLFSPSYL